VRPAGAAGPAGDTVAVQWLDFTRGEGFGAFCGAASFPVRSMVAMRKFISQMYVDSSPPLAAGREIWGIDEIPAKRCWAVCRYADRKRELCTIDVPSARWYTSTMLQDRPCSQVRISGAYSITLKLIPDIDGSRHRAVGGESSFKMSRARLVDGQTRLTLPSVSCPLRI